MSALEQAFTLDNTGQAVELVNARTTPLCSGFGQYHTNEPSKKIRNPYESITLEQIREMMDAPPSVAKEKAQWVIFSNESGEYGREADHQRKNGEYVALWADIDEAEGDESADLFSRACVAIGQRETWFYSSRSATETNQKGRLIIPLAAPVNGEQFELMQEVLNNRLAAAGITPDRATETANQVCYLPNKGAYYYADSLDELDGMEPLNPDEWAGEVAALLAERRQAEADAKQRAKASRERMAELLKTQKFLPREAAKQAYDCRDLWITFGAKPRSGGRMLSPNSGSGSAAITFPSADKWISHHQSDIDAGLGRPAENGRCCFGDAFDLICFFEYGNDERKAAAELSNQLDPDGQKQRQRAHMAAQAAESAAAEFEHMAEDEAEEPSTGEAVDLINPPGIVGDLCHLMKLSARRERPELYPAAALQLLALLSEGRQSQYTKRLNLITLAIAVTGAGKESVQEVVKELALNLKASRRIYADPGSFKEMIENLIDADGRKLYIIDEIHSLFNSMKSNKAATYETKMEAEFLKMTTTNLYTFRGREKRTVIESLGQKLKAIEKALENMSTEGDEISEKALRFMQTKAKIERHIEYIDDGWPNPFLSVMGHSVPERLDQIASDPENISSGFIGRSIVIRCPERAEALKLDLPEYEINILKAELVERLARIQYNKTQITATDEADRFIRERVAYWDAEEQRNNDHLGAIYRRAPEHLPKLASLLAVESGIITIEHARYAAAMVEQSISDIRYLLVQALAKKAGASEALQMESTRLAILKNFKGRGKVSKDDIKKKVTRKKEWQELQDKEPQRDLFEELISRMVEGGQLEYTKEGRKERYQVINK